MGVAVWGAKSWQAGQRGPAEPTMIAKHSFSVGVDYNFKKSNQKPYVFGHRLEKHIKNNMFLKVETLKFDRGPSFEIAKRSSSIRVSKKSPK